MTSGPAIRTAIETLEGRYGAPGPPVARGPFEQVLWETASYLVPDERRLEVFRRLKGEVGTRPKDVLSVPAARLAEVVRDGGMRPAMRAERLREAARVALDVGDLDAAARRPLKEARRTFQRFPAIGVPGAEKILLFAGAHAVPAFESNGLRVLVRLGYGRESQGYAATYRSAQETVAPLFGGDADLMRRAHALLRRHGQETCTRAVPRCGECVLASTCEFYRRTFPGGRKA